MSSRPCACEGNHTHYVVLATLLVQRPSSRVGSNGLLKWNWAPCYAPWHSPSEQAAFTFCFAGLSHIGEIIQRRRHFLFGHIARMDPSTPCHMALKLCGDISMGRRVPAGWKRPRGQHGLTRSGRTRASRCQHYGPGRRTASCGRGTRLRGMRRLQYLTCVLMQQGDF